MASNSDLEFVTLLSQSTPAPRMLICVKDDPLPKFGCAAPSILPQFFRLPTAKSNENAQDLTYLNETDRAKLRAIGARTILTLEEETAHAGGTDADGQHKG